MTEDAVSLLARAVAIAEEASRVPMAYFRHPLELAAKADESPVTIADRETERLIRDRIAEAFPGDGIFGEEYGRADGSTGALWIIDPIDGTRSFITGSPLFGMLLARLRGGVAQLGVVRMPALGETFAGAPGLGTTLNGRPVRVRATTRLGEALVYVNEAERIHAADPARFARLCHVGHTRRMAYDCYPHALVAAGQIDAVIDCGLEPYDYLPLVAVVEGAGGLICDWHGRPLTLESDGRVITAATPALRDQLLEVLAA